MVDCSYRCDVSNDKVQPPLENRIAEMIDELQLIHPRPDGDHEHDSSSFPFDSRTLGCNDSEMNVESDAFEEMPPPLPYYNRNVQLVVPAQQPQLVRTSLNSEPACALSANDFMLSQRFNQSTPHLQSSRLQHNRMLGLSSEFRTHSLERKSLQSRVEEFDAVLADL